MSKTLLALGTGTENTAETVYREHRGLARKKIYFRCSLDMGPEGVGLEEWAKTARMQDIFREWEANAWTGSLTMPSLKITLESA